VAAADPERAAREQVRLDGDRLAVGEHALDLEGFDRVVVAGGGKAAAAVARGLGAALGDRLAGGLVVTDGETDVPGGIEAAVGDHPLPSERNAAAVDRLLALLEGADERTLVLAPVTGGASALLSGPAGDLTVADLRETTEALLESGAAIDEINAVRKHLSTVKGGRLAARAAPATVLALLVSDVVGDDPGTIASGPFAPDPTTSADAVAVLDRYDLSLPAVREHLGSGPAASPAPDSGAFQRVHTHLLATNRTAVDAAAEAAGEAGYEPLVLSSTTRGEARELALALVAVAEECLATGRPVAPPAAIVAGGEATVTVRGDGRGGPNTELALAAGLELPAGTTLVSVDTDGSDGGTDAAGGVVEDDTVENPAAARAALADNDSYTYLDERDGLVRTGGDTNVNDLRVVLVAPAEESA
jgi:hydroxypyruvate reductase